MAGVYGAPASSLRDHALAFVPFGDGTTVEEIEALFKRLGKAGTGLHAVLQKNPSMGKLFGAINSLNMLSNMAAVNRASCSRISALGQDVLIVLEHAGRKGIDLDSGVLEAVASCFGDICILVDCFCQQGWLLRMACNERMKEEFDTLHEAVIEMLKGEKLCTMPDGRSLPAANYRDVVRPLRRMLKQMGRGCLTTGVLSLKNSESSLKEVARLLDVLPEALAQEVAQVPVSELDLDTLYHKLLQPAGQLQQLLDNQHCSISPEISSANVGAGDGADALGATPAGLYADLFRWYDKNKSGAIEEEELQAVLADLGMVEGKSPGEAALFTANHMRVADAAAAAEGQGLSFEAFCKLYDTLVMNKARQQLRFKLGLQAEDDLKDAFVSFASFGSREPVAEMDGAHFQKLCRDCDLLGRHLNVTDVDLIFAKVKSKGARKINFEQFLTALAAISEKKVVAFEDTVTQVLEAGGPIAHATKADSVRLHDDKSCYTGVYARGGPTNVEHQFELSAYLDRSFNAPTDVRGVKKNATPKSAKKVVMVAGEATPEKQAATEPHISTATSGIASTTPGISRRVSTIGAEPPASPTTPLSECGRLSSHGDAQVAAAAMRSPSASGCLSISSRRQSGSGQHAPMRTSSLKDVLKEAFSSFRIKKGDKSASQRCRDTQQQDCTPVKQSTPGRAGALEGAVVSQAGDAPSLKDVFSAFAAFGIHTPTTTKLEPVFHTNTATPTPVRRVSNTGTAAGRAAGSEMDGFRFVKLCREAGIIDSRFTTTSADLVFAKVKTKGCKKITFRQFNEALAMVAAVKGVDAADIMEAVESCGAPAINATTPDTVRLHDAALVGTNC